MRLLRVLILRPLRRDLLRTALSILSVALGVAVVVAIDLAGDAATGSFQSSLQTLTGRTDLEVIANGGIDERIIARLAALQVDAKYAPIIEAQGVVPGVGAVPVYGVDAIGEGELPEPPVERKSDAVPVFVSKPLASRIAGRSLVMNLGGRREAFEIAGNLEGAGEFVLMDIADAQQALRRYGKLDRIDITAGRGQDFAAVERAVRAVLPPGYLLQRPGTHSEENQRMLGAFRWNLRVLSYISLVVGAFLIYNTISVSVVRRRAEIGILRAVGAARGTVLALFLEEAAMLGVTGAVLGVVLGRLLAEGAVALIAGTVNALYTTSRPAAIALTPTEFWSGIVTGAIVAIGSAFGPAREAMQIAPTEAMQRGAREHHASLRWKRGLAAGIILAVLGAACAQLDPIQGYPIGGYAAALLAIAASALCSPVLVLAMNRLTRGLMRKRPESLLAGRSLAAALSRTSVVLAALATAIAMMASVGIMVGSFRETVALWLDNQLRADLYVRPAVPSGAGEFPPMPDEVPRILASAAGVEAVDVFHAVSFHYRGERATLGAGNMEVVRTHGRLRFLSGQDRDAILRSLPNADRAIASEPFANKHHLRAGDRIQASIGARQVALTIAGVYYEYSSSQGYLILDRTTLLRYLPDQPATSAAVYLRPGTDAGQVERELQLRTANYGVIIAPNRALRQSAIEIFDRTFAITWALEAVAILVAMLGAANSLLALVLDRRRELGLLRYLGASTEQIRRMILTEAAFLGALALLLGVALGSALSLVLIFVVNKQSFGWTIQFHPPALLLGGALALVWCVTVFAGIYPARVAAALHPIDVIHEE